MNMTEWLLQVETLLTWTCLSEGNANCNKDVLNQIIVIMCINVNTINTGR